MTSIKFGIIKEGKVPIDRRVPITPEQAKEIQDKFEGVKIYCQKSDIRCYDNEDYTNEGIEVVDDISDCDVILGVKEVPIPELLNDKTFFFFSHTIKMQDYNQKLLQEILSKNIKLIDYETLVDENNQRVIAFGRYAGIVGAYNGIWTYGKRYNLFNIRRAKDCFDLEDLKTEFTKFKLPPIKIAITGGGRVTKGAMEVMFGMGIRRVTPSDFLNERFDEPVFTQLSTRDYNKKMDGGEFNRHHFYDHPYDYEGDFLKYAKVTDLLIACAYWDPKAPKLFDRNDAVQNDFRIKIIADVTCDIDGSIPSTIRPTVIDDPIYDYNPTEGTEEPALSEEGNITVMAVDNLPCELPRDASRDFGRMLIDNVLPSLLGDDDQDIIKNATITENGKLTEKYSYLQDYADGK